ncbi:hypothetical protein [Ralstonia solanacearum]|uniref:hypothetical protein n=1 Tax=Ralstonia solanacearum TaxID=305 RepID=UPI0013A622F7|nr:hypothetical protein [Ralstonia solanacearum]
MGQADLKPHDFTRHDSHQSTHEPNGRAGAFDCTCRLGVPFTARNNVLLRRQRFHPITCQSDDFMMAPLLHTVDDVQGNHPHPLRIC